MSAAPKLSELDLDKEIRDALTYYYDFAHLQRHPLASHLIGDHLATRQTRAKALRRILLEAIEDLNPGNAVAMRAPERRPYAILMGIYIEGQTQTEVAQTLAISERQLRRERTAAFKALTSIIRDRYLTQSDESRGQQDALHNEIMRLAQERELIDIADVVDELMSLIQSLADERGFTLSAFVPPDLPHPKVNRVLLRQALIDLATHLATELPLRHLTFEAQPRADYAAVGIRARWDQDKETGGPLTNLYPQSAETIVHALGGKLAPRLAHDSKADATIAIMLPTEREILVLIVDDNESLFALFQRYTVGHPYRLLHASGMEQAMAMIEAYTPQVITVDLMMPQHDGWELLQFLKSNPRYETMAIIVCSVLAQPELAKIQGADFYLKKPVAQSGLLRVLNQAESLIRLQAARQEFPAHIAEAKGPEDH
jgi:CheY-like chemotaxis protein